MLNFYRLLAIPLLAATFGTAALVQADPKTPINDEPQQWGSFISFERSGVGPAPIPDVDATVRLAQFGILDPRDRAWLAREEIRRQSEDRS